MAYLRINHSSEERQCPVYNFLIPKIKKKEKKSYVLILNLSVTSPKHVTFTHLLPPLQKQCTMHSKHGEIMRLSGIMSHC